MKSFLPFNFAITKICVAIRLAEDETKMGGIQFRLSPSNIKKSLGFSQLNTFFATFWKCLSTHFGHMRKIKTSLNILLRIIEHDNRLHDNRLPDHLFFYRLCFLRILRNFKNSIFHGTPPVAAYEKFINFPGKHRWRWRNRFIFLIHTT